MLRVSLLYYDILFCEALDQTRQCMSEASSVLVEGQFNRCKEEKKMNVSYVWRKVHVVLKMDAETLFSAKPNHIS